TLEWVDDELEMSRVRTYPFRPGRWMAALLLVAAATLPACSAETVDPGGTPLTVTLTDFKMASTVLAAVPGGIRFDVDNRSPVTHEFVVVRTDFPADRLPLGPNGLSVDEDQVEVVGELGQVDTRTSETLALDLPAGRYVYFCNLEGHYLGGMHGTLEVSDA
ncbi:MAG: hypothetical protein ABI869_00005, partial [Actinomycetota bacterium]